MKNSSKVLVLMLISVMFLSVDMYAQRPGYDCGGHKNGKGIENAIPDLTEQQKSDIKKIRIDYDKKVLPITNELRERRAHLKTLQTASTPDKKAIDAEIDKIGKLRTDMMKLREEQRLKVREVLTDDQKVVFDTKMANKRHMMHHGKGHKCNH